MKIPPCSYLNPCKAPKPHVIKRFHQLNGCHKFLVITATIFAGIASCFMGGLGGLAVFRKLVDQFNPEKKSPKDNKTVQRTNRIALQRVLNPGEKISIAYLQEELSRGSKNVFIQFIEQQDDKIENENLEVTPELLTHEMKKEAFLQAKKQFLESIQPTKNPENFNPETHVDVNIITIEKETKFEKKFILKKTETLADLALQLMTYKIPLLSITEDWWYFTFFGFNEPIMKSLTFDLKIDSPKQFDDIAKMEINHNLFYTYCFEANKVLEKLLFGNDNDLIDREEIRTLISKFEDLKFSKDSSIHQKIYLYLYPLKIFLHLYDNSLLQKGILKETVDYIVNDAGKIICEYFLPDLNLFKMKIRQDWVRKMDSIRGEVSYHDGVVSTTVYGDNADILS